VMVGTPQYMSPEQFSGMKVDGRSDLFSAAVIVYEMLTGEHPFPAHGVEAIMHQVIKVDPVPPKDLNFTVNDNLSAVVIKALNKNPRRRYQDGKKMAAALVEALKENADPAVLELAAPAGGDAEASTVITGPDAATVVSSVRPDGAAADSMASAPGARPSLIRRSVSRRAFVIPVVAALAVVAGVLLLISGSNGSNNPGAAPSGPGIAKVDLTVWLADTEAAYTAAINDEDYTACVPDGTANIVVTGGDTGEKIERSSFLTGIIDLQKPAGEITVQCQREAYEDFRKGFPATEPNQRIRINAVLQKKAPAG